MCTIVSDPPPSLASMSSTFLASQTLQPSFDDLGTPLSEATFVVLDLETTGSTHDDQITEIGAVKVRGGEVIGEFQTLVNPTTTIPPLIAVPVSYTHLTLPTTPYV